MGYGTDSTGEACYTGVGFYFNQVNGQETFDLTDIKVECIGGNEYMDPNTEYLRELSPESAADIGRYTYVNEVLLRALFEDSWDDEYLKMIGWWKVDLSFDMIEDIIAQGKTEYMVAKGEKVFNVRTAFLGQFAGTGVGGCDYKFTCAGQVINYASEIQTGEACYWYFPNYTPAKCMLTDIEVECEGGNEYMDPNTEYLRELNPESAADIGRYAYVNEILLRALFEDSWDDEYLKMIGWWKVDLSQDMIEVIASGDTSLMINEDTDIEMKPGFAFLGQFAGTGVGGCNYHIKFPNPLQPVDAK